MLFGKLKSTHSKHTQLKS